MPTAALHKVKSTPSVKQKPLRLLVKAMNAKQKPLHLLVKAQIVILLAVKAMNVR
jgi:hypothetical protein